MITETLILNTAYLILLASTFTRTILRLRLALIGSAIAFLVYGILIRNWSMVGWNVVTASLHGYQLFKYLGSRRSIVLDAEAEAVRGRLFPNLDNFDFNAIWALGETTTIEDEPLTVTGAVNNHLHLILDGEVAVEKRDGSTIRMGQDELVGEFSFVNGETAVATCVPAPTVTVRTWDHSRLTAVDDLSPNAAKALNAFIHGELVRKVQENITR